MLLPDMDLLFRLTFLAAILSPEISAQQNTAPDLIESSCRRSLIQHDLPAEFVLKKFVRFSAIDQNGREIVITDLLATKCGYTVAQDDWGKITFRISLYSCFVQIQNDTYFTVPVKIEISSRPDMVGAISYIKTTSCPYYFSPREILCETNYMEVSVRRKIPVIAEGFFRNEPEDWASAFDPAVAGLMSIWQVVFHKSSSQKTTMLIDAAQNMGYGINTTESRTLLRSPYNATEAVPQKVGGVTFSTLRATLFYKQRWFIYLIDNAVACPVDDVIYSPGWIIWSIPKSIFPLLVGAKIVQRSSYQFGVDLVNITNEQITASNYDITDTNGAITVRIPIGAKEGFYKSHVVNQVYGITYNIKPFLENVWTDDGWGVTKYTIIKDLTTPFEQRPSHITNGTIPSTMIFTVTVGTFLPDVQLVNITIGGVTLSVPQAIDHGFTMTPIKYPNGTVDFGLKVPFIEQAVAKKILPDGVLFVLNVTFGFNIVPYDEVFTTTGIIEYFMPQPIVGPCSRKGSMLTTTIGNLDPNLDVYIQDTMATTNNGLLIYSNQTSSTVQVDQQSDMVKLEAVGTGVMAAVPINIKDHTGATIYSFVISCELEVPVVCLPEGIIQVTVKKISNVPDMDMSSLTLRDATCRPARFDSNNAYFSFFASSCRTSRTFENNLMTYYNEIHYNRISGKPILIMNVTCSYTTNGTVVVTYNYENNPTPSAVSIMASLDLVLRLSKDFAYTNFYGDVDYPVVKYLREPLYFEVELLYSSDSRLELFLDTCWATASPDMSSSPSWPIVANSCEYEESYQTIFHKVTADSRVQFPSHFKRFEVKTFSFMDGDKTYTGEIFFHCDVIICDASNLSSDPVCRGVGSCIPAKQRMGRSADEDNVRSISSGAVVLLVPRVESYAIHS